MWGMREEEKRSEDQEPELELTGREEEGRVRELEDEEMMRNGDFFEVQEELCTR